MSIKITKPRSADYKGSPAEALCACGHTVVLSDPLDNICDFCQRCYNMSGQEVTPSWECDAQGNPYDYD